MPFDCLFNPLWLNADVALRDCGGALLQKPLDKGKVISKNSPTFVELFFGTP